MKKHIMIMRAGTLLLLMVMLTNCNNEEHYKVGNRVTIDLKIDTEVSFKVLRLYLRKMSISDYSVPDKWRGYNKLVDIDSANTLRIYFAKHPEEMYLVQFNGELFIADVLNEQIVKGDWIARKERLRESDKVRIIERFKVEILDQVVSMAKKDGIPDSILYFKPYH